MINAWITKNFTMSLSSQILMESRSVLLQNNFSRRFRIRSIRCNHSEKWRISIFIFVHLKKMFFTRFFPRKQPILYRENGFFILKTTQNVLLVILWKYRDSFFKFFFLKMAECKVTTITNYLSCRLYQTCLVYFNLMMLDYS